MTKTVRTASSAGEQVLLDLIRQSYTTNDPNISIGVCDNDDAAVIDISSETQMVIGTDFIRGKEFYLFQQGLLSPYDLGYFLVIANISDIISMGATPRYITTNIRYKNDTSVDDFNGYLSGIKDACKKYETSVVGGDIGGYREDVLTATAIGFLDTKPLTRNGAEKGDLLCIAGKTGLATTAVLYFCKLKGEPFSLPTDEEDRLLQAWKRPTAMLDEMRLLSKNGIATSCMDVSDGLKASVEILEEASNVSFNINLDSIPLDPLTYKVAAQAGIAPLRLASSASPDFSLLFTIPPNKLELARDLFSKHNKQLDVIGIAADKSAGAHNQSISGISWDQTDINLPDALTTGDE